MFRYHVEVLDCDSWKASPGKSIEIQCQKRGARCRVDRLPGEVTVRSAPEVDDLFFSLLEGNAVIATSDAFTIGGPVRRVGSRKIPLHSADSEEPMCSVHILWSVEEEDGSVFSRPVEDFVPAASPLSLMHDTEDRVYPSKRKADQSNASNDGSSSTTATLRSATMTPRNREANWRDEEGEKEEDAAEPMEKKKVVLAVDDETEAQQSSSKDDSAFLPHAPWFLSAPQYAPVGMIDYYATSTQVLQPPMSWTNLYTSISPLLDASKLDLPAYTKTSKGWSYTVVSASREARMSAIESIKSDPTRMPEVLSSEELQREVYRRAKTPLTRTFISLSSYNMQTTSSSRR